MGDVGEYWRDVKRYWENYQPTPEEQKAHEMFIRQENKRNKRLENMLKENGIEIKKYPHTGQWSLGSIVDWWTTTGTAIARKSRKQFIFSNHEPEYIIKSVLKIKKELKK